MMPKPDMAIVLRVAGALLLVLLIVLAVNTCQKKNTLEAQSKMDKAQTGAVIESSKDASNVQATVAANDAATADVSRQNEKEIRDAKGADAVVDPAVLAARLNSLCRRAAYRNDPACRVQQPR